MRPRPRGRAATCALTINRWGNPRPPAPDDFFKSIRGRSAFRVVEFIPRKREGAKTYGTVRCVRVKPSEIPPGAQIWDWEWAHR